MRAKLLEILSCPRCGRRVGVDDAEPPIPGHPDYIERAELRCEGCGQGYPVDGGIVDVLFAPSSEVEEEIEGNRAMVSTDRSDCDDDWLLGLPETHRRQRPQMATHDETADFEGLAANVPGRARILDLGAGTCWTSSRWARLGNDVVASDVSIEKFVGLRSASTFIQHTGHYFERVRFDMNGRWPFADEAFDIVAAMSAVHHALDLKAVFSEAARVLRPGGSLLLVETTRSLFQREAAARFGEYERYVFHRQERIYTQLDYRTAAAVAGLALKVVAAPSFAKKIGIVAGRHPLFGERRMKHRLAAAIAPLLGPRYVRALLTGPMFVPVNLVFGSQFVGVASKAAP